MKTQGLLILSLTLTMPEFAGSAQDEETVLGKPSPIQPSNREQETLVLEAGAQLRQQPRYRSPVVEILPMSLELPVLDRHGSWVKVRFGTWQGWVHPGGNRSTTGQELSSSLGPDDQRLLGARSLLDEEVEPRTLGPFTLYSDVIDEELLEWLSAVAWDVLRAYRERFGLDPGSPVGEVVVLFADEADYRDFEAAEARIAKTNSRGYTSEGLSVLFMGESDRTSLVSVFIHELGHLLNRRVIRSVAPPWLEEGMAEDLAFSQVTDQGLIRLGTLAGEQRQGHDDRYSISEPRAHVEALIAAWKSPTRPDLDTLTTMDWGDLIRPEDRAIHYAESAMLLRYFMDGGEQNLRRGFRRYLSAVAKADLAASVSLWDEVGAGPEEVELGLYRFVSNQARAHGLR